MKTRILGDLEKRRRPVRCWRVKVIADYGKMGKTILYGVVDARSGSEAIELLQVRGGIEMRPGMILKGFAILKAEGGAT